MASACRICGGGTYRWLAGLYDDRYGYPGSFDMDACRSCDHRQLDASFDAAALRSLYTEYYPRASFDLENWRAAAPSGGIGSWLAGEASAAFRWVPRDVRVLDIGCGFGESLGYHKSRGCEVHGVDADENIRRVAERYGFEVQVGLFDKSHYQRDYFDVVTLDQVIEHAMDPVEMLRGVAAVLKPGGDAIVSTPNPDGWGARRYGRRWINWHVPYHLHQFSASSMAEAARRAGLSLRRRLTRTHSEWLFYQWLHLGSDPAQGEPHAFWSPRGAPDVEFNRARERALRLRRLRVNQALTRWFDFRGKGDNQLFFLRRPPDGAPR